MRRVLLAMGILAVAPVARASAQTTVSYSATVTFASGTDATAFSAGDSLTFSYTLDTSVPDSSSGDPSTGIFHNAVTSFSLSFPGRSISANAGAAGNVQTFDNYVDASGSWSDQVFFFGGPVTSASQLGGAPIDSIEVDFLSAFLTPPDEPTLLTSDAIPVGHLSGNQNFVVLHTANGYTFVHFSPVATPTVHVTANGAEDLLTLGHGDPLAVSLGFDAGPSGSLNPAEVYVGVIAPFAPYIFWLDQTGNFVHAAAPIRAFSGTLNSFPLMPRLSFPDSSVLPPGSYYWFMIVDNDSNGVVNGTFHDYVQTIVPQ